jgi:hypothetical protein
MSVYDRANYTGLVDNIPLLHRGKRYFVDLHLHNREIGTPFLKYCYGSKNYVSESELREKYKTETSRKVFKTVRMFSFREANASKKPQKVFEVVFKSIR